MWIPIAAIVAIAFCDCCRANFLLGYTAESCDDLRPHRIPFVQDVMGQADLHTGLGANGLPINLPGFNRPNPSGSISGPGGVNAQPTLMTTVTPYRIITSDSRYKQGRSLEGLPF